MQLLALFCLCSLTDGSWVVSMVLTGPHSLSQKWCSKCWRRRWIHYHAHCYHGEQKIGNSFAAVIKRKKFSTCPKFSTSPCVNRCLWLENTFRNQLCQTDSHPGEWTVTNELIFEVKQKSLRNFCWKPYISY